MVEISWSGLKLVEVSWNYLKCKRVRIIFEEDWQKLVEIDWNRLKLNSIEIFYKCGLKYVEVGKIEFTNGTNKVDKSWLKLVEIEVR